MKIIPIKHINNRLVFCFFDCGNNDLNTYLQKYAFACVSQSNSKISRLNRLEILEKILLHKSDSESNDYEEFLEYLRDEFGVDEIPVKDINGYSLIDYKNI